MRIVSALIVFTLLFGAGPASANSDKGPSAEETAAYIAAKLKNCGTVERTQVRAAIDGPDVTITENTNTPDFQSSETVEFNIREITIVDFVQHDRREESTRLVFYCEAPKQCISSSWKTSSGFKGQSNQSSVEVPMCDADTGERLTRAFRHLMKVTGKMKDLF